MGYRDYSTAKGRIVDPNGLGDFTTIASALTAASSGQDIFIRPGTYTENLTLKAGVNLVGFGGDGLNPQVNIIGKATFTGTGTVTISNVQLQTTSDFLLAVTGSSASIVNINSCTLNASNNTGISHTSSNSSSAININNNNLTLGTTGIALFTSTSAGNITINQCALNNNGGSSTSSTISTGTVSLFQCNFPHALTTSSVGSISCFYTNIGLTAQNIAGITTAGTGTSNLYFSSFGSGTGSCISVGTGTTVNCYNCAMTTSNANPVTGAGTFNYSNLTNNSATGVLNPSTLNGFPNYSGSISFDGGTNFLSNYTVGTFTPGIAFGGGTTGITYSGQTGNYTRIGNCVFVILVYGLTSKGSSTGTMTFTGLPFTAAITTAILTVLETNVTFVGNYLLASVASGGTVGNIGIVTTATTVTNLTDTAFANNSTLRITGFYYV